MSWQVVNLPALTVATTSAVVTNAIGNLDDAEGITLFFTSSATSLSSGTLVQISQFDPAINAPAGVTQSTGFFGLSSAIGSFSTTSTSRNTLTIASPITFRGLRLSVLASANVAGEVVAFATKTIFV